VQLEELRSEKRILQAEREETISRLLSIQKDLEDVLALEGKLISENQKLEEDLRRRTDDEEYVTIRG
jgi:hypothetical protein